jgi:UPF0755 protein
LQHLLKTIIAIAVLSGSICLAAAAIWLHSELQTPYYGAQSPEIYIDIARGMSTNQIANLLVISGALRSRLPFIVYLRYKGLGRRVQAGEYRFSSPATPKQVAQRLIQGDVYFLLVTVPEGLTARETVDLIAQKGLGKHDEMEQALQRTDWIRDLDPRAQSLEGYLFPETYHFSRKSSSEMIIKTMVDQFRLRFAAISRDNPLQPGWSLAKTVILASMVEKEAKKVEEGPLVASVFANRLAKRIPLACDATIIYAMKLAGTYRGNLSKEDLRMDSPYNTYLHLNLPPSPICNPGANSIRAAINPASTDYLYYVARNDGTHQFSKDLSSHIDAVNRYQKSIARRNRKAH